MKLNEYARAVHENAVAHGWYDNGIEFEGACDKPENERTCKPEGLAVELCDAIMRILDYLAYMHVDVEAVLEAKHAYNLGRPYRHGGKKA